MDFENYVQLAICFIAIILAILNENKKKTIEELEEKIESLKRRIRNNRNNMSA